ncbi:MAG: tetratricopeptide repeat protein [Deltaproteobacteria bacterium]|nr:tetratricopeptide repeat protein [Deltaproteobacteria bacterium]
MGDPKSNTSCPRLDDVQPYLDDLLSAENKTAFVKHLTGCSTCRKEVEAFREISGLIRQTAKAALPKLDTARVRLRLFSGSVSAKTSWLAPAFAFSAAAAVVILAIIFWPVQSKKASTPGPDSPRTAAVIVPVEPALVTFKSAGTKGPRQEGELWLLDPNTASVTDANSALAYRLDKRISVVIFEETQASFDRLPDGTLVVDLSKGSLVARLARPLQGKFAVKTPAGVIEASGTIFAVRVVDEFASQVWLLEGSVEVTPKFGPGNSLRAPACAVFGSKLQQKKDPADPTGHSMLARAKSLDPFVLDTELGWVSQSSHPSGGDLVINNVGIPAHRLELATPAKVEAQERIKLAKGKDPLVKIKKLLAKRKYAKATKDLAGYLARKPNDPKATFLLGDAHRLSGEVDKSLAAYHKVVEASHDPSLSEAAIYQIGRLQLQVLSEPEQARQTFRRLVKEYPNGLLRQEVSFHLAECQIALKDYSAAIMALQAYLADYPQGTKAAEAQALLEAFKEKGWR